MLTLLIWFVDPNKRRRLLAYMYSNFQIWNYNKVIFQFSKLGCARMFGKYIYYKKGKKLIMKFVQVQNSICVFSRVNNERDKKLTDKTLI